jgi:hypothetical protein
VERSVTHHYAPEQKSRNISDSDFDFEAGRQIGNFADIFVQAIMLMMGMLFIWISLIPSHIPS